MSVPSRFAACSSHLQPAARNPQPAAGRLQLAVCPFVSSAVCTPSPLRRLDHYDRNSSTRQAPRILARLPTRRGLARPPPHPPHPMHPAQTAHSPRTHLRPRPGVSPKRSLVGPARRRPRHPRRRTSPDSRRERNGNRLAGFMRLTKLMGLTRLVGVPGLVRPVRASGLVRAVPWS